MTRIGSRVEIRIEASASATGFVLVAFILILFAIGGCKKKETYLKDDKAYFQEHLRADMDYNDLVETFGVPPVDLNAATADEADGLHIYQYPLYDSTFLRIGFTNRMEYACWVDERNNLIEDVIVIHQTVD